MWKHGVLDGPKVVIDEFRAATLGLQCRGVFFAPKVNDIAIFVWVWPCLQD
jgi:hypothetical protein